MCYAFDQKAFLLHDVFPALPSDLSRNVVLTTSLFKKEIGGHKSFLRAHVCPSFRLLVTSALGFAASVNPYVSMFRCLHVTDSLLTTYCINLSLINRLLCGNTHQIKALLSHEALRLVGETLKSELQPVYTAAFKTVAEFTKAE